MNQKNAYSQGPQAWGLGVLDFLSGAISLQFKTLFIFSYALGDYSLQLALQEVAIIQLELALKMENVCYPCPISLFFNWRNRGSC